MNEKRKELLAALDNEINDLEYIGEHSIFTKEELSIQTDILRAEIKGFGVDLVSVLGEFFFIPFENEDYHYFTSVITLSSTITKEAAPDIAACISRLNYIVPCGCFALGGQDHNLIFRWTVPVSAEDTEEKQRKTIFDAANVAIGNAERYEGYLRLIINNEITLEELLEMFKNQAGQ